MNKLKILFVLLFIISASVNAQGFKVKAAGSQTFSFRDDRGRNQVTFYSATPLEDINGTANGVSGSVSFDVANFAKTLNGKISVSVASMNTGIELRNHHLQGPNWLDAKSYPEITFLIKSVVDAKQIADNKISFKVSGDFSLHGVTKEITADCEATYLDENDQTRKRTPGDLLGIRAKFNIVLSDFDIDNAIIGTKVAQNIEIGVNIVGSNKF